MIIPNTCERKFYNMTDQFNTRKTLLMRAKDPNDQLAWNEFVEYYSGFIQMLLHKMKIPQQLHDDLKQEVLLKIWKALGQYEVKQDIKFRTWLSVVIRNGILAYMRSYRKRKNRESALSEESLFNEENFEPSQVEKIIDEEWANYMVSHVVEHLRQFFSGKAIDVFLMSSKGKSTQEISDDLQIPANTVYVLRSRVKDRLLIEMKNLRQVLEF
ncbi:sigma-70 family RNA polymerase sigma factor [Lentisphaera profundi]|uniref:RNA polymerase sigma factor SigS n=1 Tax=Lentisphaera profundi TaxID=1658616 RepID=A0ABY7VVQ5_9BACT|nr:sigma-70 family RNA polymerase sigma factor [Lentisphaera profundi]WDE98162.1 sigma-70 family RNA polymerase sigma factor [Lentisphaera profundi]